MYIHLIAFACVSSLCRLTDKKSVYHLMSDRPTFKKMRLEDVTTVGSRNTHRMEQPQGIVADTDGNMYVTTIDGIFRIDAKTEMMTQIAILAGSKGIVLNTEGSILVASQTGIKQIDVKTFTTTSHTVGDQVRKWGITLDTNGDVLIAELHRHCICRVHTDIDGNNQVSVVAGVDGVPGHHDGTATVARFFRPRDLAIDKHGNIFVVDQGNSSIRLIDGRTGEVRTFRGQEPNTSPFMYPCGIVYVDFCLFVADTFNHVIRRINLQSGVVDAITGHAPNAPGHQDGSLDGALVQTPRGLTYSNGDLLIADTGNNCIRRVRNVASRKPTFKHYTTEELFGVVDTFFADKSQVASLPLVLVKIVIGYIPPIGYEWWIQKIQMIEQLQQNFEIILPLTVCMTNSSANSVSSG